MPARLAGARSPCTAGARRCPTDAPPSRVPLVELEWKQFDEESGGIVVARRVWAPTVGEALQTMVEDRRTDMTLEQIEQAAADEGDLWWND